MATKPKKLNNQSTAQLAKALQESVIRTQTVTTMTTENPLKYEEYLRQSQVEINEEQRQFQVESAKLSLQSDILATKKHVAKAKANLLNAKRKHPFCSQTIIDAQLEVEGFNDGLIRLEILLEELF